MPKFLSNNPILSKVSIFLSNTKILKYIQLSICICIALVEIYITLRNAFSNRHLVISYIYSLFCYTSLIVAIIGIMLQRIKWCFRVWSIFGIFVVVYLRLLCRGSMWIYLVHFILSVHGAVLSFYNAVLLDRKEA